MYISILILGRLIITCSGSYLYRLQNNGNYRLAFNFFSDNLVAKTWPNDKADLIFANLGNRVASGWLLIFRFK